MRRLIPLSRAMFWGAAALFVAMLMVWPAVLAPQRSWRIADPGSRAVAVPVAYAAPAGTKSVAMKNTCACTVTMCLYSDFSLADQATNPQRKPDDGPCDFANMDWLLRDKSAIERIISLPATKLTAGRGHTLTIPVRPGDHLYLDAAVTAGPTKRGVDITGSTWCRVSGTVQSLTLRCDGFHATAAPTMSPPSIAPYDPAKAIGSDDKPAQTNLLNVLAWCVSAAGVAGLIIVGTQLALQVRRGVPGALSEIRQEIVVVAVACIASITVGPIVSYLAISLW